LAADYVVVDEVAKLVGLNGIPAWFLGAVPYNDRTVRLNYGDVQESVGHKAGAGDNGGVVEPVVRLVGGYLRARPFAADDTLPGTEKNSCRQTAPYNCGQQKKPSSQLPSST
jgi:hypothetical protein